MTSKILAEVFLEVDLKPNVLETILANSLTFNDFSKLNTKSIAFSISKSEIGRGFLFG